MAIRIGLEIHCRLNTKSKLFCSCSTNSQQKEPNNETCPICLGLPGYKPLLNKSAVEYLIKMGLAFNCDISEESYFSRKTYFYPDMSKNFQITQYEIPIATNGSIHINDNEIKIRRIHLEEDPARIVYANGSISTTKYILIDYNRAGAPLAELVTEPDIKSPKEARLLLEKISSILDYLGVYDPSNEASIRVDANISSDGERVEIKNITGFENVEKALSYEEIRQKGMSRMNKKIERETRHFDETTKMTTAMRKKEYEEDYGYIFDPDLPLINIDKKWVEQIKSQMPELPEKRAVRMALQYNIDQYDANVIVYTGRDFADFFENCIKKLNKPKEISKWMINYLLKSLNWRSERISNSKVTVDRFIEFIELIDKNIITERFGKELIKEFVDSGNSPKELASKISTQTKPLNEVVESIIKENQKAFDEFKLGKKEALQFLIGKVLNATGKRSDPKEIVNILNSMLEK